MRESRAISAMVRLATSRAVVGADVFDSDAMLFNTQNGVYDMKTRNSCQRNLLISVPT